MKNSVKSFELVLVGHPDKFCDLVSNEICKYNAGGRNAIECCWGNRLFTVNGETDAEWGDARLELFVKGLMGTVLGMNQDEVDSVKVVNNLNVQSPEIDRIVGDLGTGDNGIYFGGYHRIYSPVLKRMKELCAALTAEVLKDWGYRTDGKFIFAVGKKGNIVELVINCAKFMGKAPNPIALSTFIRAFSGSETRVTVNPKGDWYNCFAFADCGLTGRKLACDGTCGLFSHGGGAMFGKDVSKADVTVPLYLSHLAETNPGKWLGLIPKKSCGMSAASIIGDTHLDIYRDGKFLKRVAFAEMKKYVSDRNLNIFGVLSERCAKK